MLHRSGIGRFYLFLIETYSLISVTGMPRALRHFGVDLERSHLAMEVSGHDTLTKTFDAVHLCLCAALTLIAVKFSP